ncbi:MAG: glycosyltransferase family A protein [Verrucomicrobiota bacterium]
MSDSTEEVVAMREKATFSVLIPTLNRASTLADTIGSCLLQRDQNFRIVISDNHSDDDTAAIIRQFEGEDERVVGIRPPEQLPMSDHWNWALRELPKGFFMVLGSDDALTPDSVARARKAIASVPGASAVVGSWAHYQYPNLDIGNSGHLSAQVASGSEVRNGSEWVPKLAGGLCGPGELPMPYALAYVHTDMLNRIEEKSGGLIFGACPDYYLATAIGSVIDEYVVLKSPLALAGISGSSNGLKTLNPNDPTSISKGDEFMKEGVGKRDESLPYVANWHVILAETILKAKEAGVVDDDIEIRWDRFASQAYGEFRNQDWSESDASHLFDQLKALAKATGNEELFDGVTGFHEEPKKPELKAPFKGWVGLPMDFTVDTRPYGVRHVGEAARMLGIISRANEVEQNSAEFPGLNAQSDFAILGKWIQRVGFIDGADLLLEGVGTKPKDKLTRRVEDLRSAVESLSSKQGGRLTRVIDGIFGRAPRGLKEIRAAARKLEREVLKKVR